jgi:hypothetical protein
VHRRPLIQPDEVGRCFTRIDSKDHPAYPGFALVMVAGANPFVVRRTHYFEDMEFIDCFSPHPDHKFLPAIPTTVDGIRPLIDMLEAAMSGHRLTISEWLIETGRLAAPSQAAAKIARVPPDNRTVYIEVPCSGKVSAIAATGENILPSGEYWIPEGALFTVKNYSAGAGGIDPFRQLREACFALEAAKSKQPFRGGLFFAIMKWLGASVRAVLAWLFKPLGYSQGTKGNAAFVAEMRRFGAEVGFVLKSLMPPVWLRRVYRHSLAGKVLAVIAYPAALCSLLVLSVILTDWDGLPDWLNMVLVMGVFVGFNVLIRALQRDKLTDDPRSAWLGRLIVVAIAWCLAWYLSAVLLNAKFF